MITINQTSNDTILPYNYSIFIEEKIKYTFCSNKYGLNNIHSNPFNIRLSHTKILSNEYVEYTYIFDKLILPFIDIYNIIMNLFKKCKCDYCQYLRKISNIPFDEIIKCIHQGHTSYKIINKKI
jgi:hypothetical protein